MKNLVILMVGFAFLLATRGMEVNNDEAPKEEEEILSCIESSSVVFGTSYEPVQGLESDQVDFSILPPVVNCGFEQSIAESRSEHQATLFDSSQGTQDQTRIQSERRNQDHLCSDCCLFDCIEFAGICCHLIFYGAANID